MGKSQGVFVIERPWVCVLRGVLETFVRKARALLNKMTVEKYEKLSQQLLDSGINKPQHVENLVLPSL